MERKVSEERVQAGPAQRDGAVGDTQREPAEDLEVQDDAHERGGAHPALRPRWPRPPPTISAFVTGGQGSPLLRPADPGSARGALLLAAALTLLGLRLLLGLFVALSLGGAGLRRALDRSRQELCEIDDLRAATRRRAGVCGRLAGRGVAGDGARFDLLVDRGQHGAAVLVGVPGGVE